MSATKAQDKAVSRYHVGLLRIADAMQNYRPTSKLAFEGARKLRAIGLLEESDRVPGSFEITEAGLNYLETIDNKGI